MIHRRALGLEGRTYRNNSEKRNTEWIADLLIAEQCADCGNDDPRVLQFHHLDQSSKLYSISSIISSGYSLDKLKAEVDKCIIVCANCHIIRHKEDNSIGMCERWVSSV